MCKHLLIKHQAIMKLQNSIKQTESTLLQNKSCALPETNKFQKMHFLFICPIPITVSLQFSEKLASVLQTNQQLLWAAICNNQRNHKDVFSGAPSQRVPLFDQFHLATSSNLQLPITVYQGTHIFPSNWYLPACP